MTECNGNDPGIQIRGLHGPMPKKADYSEYSVYTPYSAEQLGNVLPTPQMS
jgi:hypothetical protein